MSTNENTMIVLAGGTNVEVKLKDGATETIFVRKIPIRDMPALGKAWGKEHEEILVYADGERQKGWEDTLTDEGWEKVIETGRELNEGPFGRWYARQEKALRVIGVNVEDVLVKATSDALQKPTNS